LFSTSGENQLDPGIIGVWVMYFGLKKLKVTVTLFKLLRIYQND
jgi:hypothetical protein